MWWTAITLGAVAAWFEWTYRHSRKLTGGKKNPPKEREQPDQAEKTVEPEQAAK